MQERVLSHFLERLAVEPATAEIVECAARADDKLVVTGARAGAAPALLALLARRLGRTMLVVTSSLERAEALTDGLAFFGARPLIYPSFETLPFEETEPVLHIAAARNAVLAELAHLDPEAPQAAPLIVAPVDALAFRPLPREALLHQSLTIRWGQTLDPEALAAQLVGMGFRREALVESPGEFAIRGSIIDVYPPDASNPWRLDLFGEEIDQIRAFDPQTQRSLPRDAETEAVRILAPGCVEPKLAWLRAGHALGSLFDLLPENSLVVLDGPFRLDQRLRRFDEIATRHWGDIQRIQHDDQVSFFVEHNLTPGQWLLSRTAVQEALTSFQSLDLTDLGSDIEEEEDNRPAEEALAGRRLTFPAQGFESVTSQFQNYLGLIRERLRKGHWVAIVCDNNGQVMRLDELLRENEISALPLVDGQPAPALPRSAADRCPDVLLMVGDLHEGFHSPQAGIFIVTDREIFGRYKRRHVYRKAAARGKAISNPTEIQRGDYVVHIEHGIAHFERIRRQNVDGRLTEFLELVYQNDDRLLVPVDKLHLIQKYASADGKPPTLDRLGSRKWQSRRRKSMEAVRKMAGELLELYARREAAEGYAYAPDSAWQQEFEASFIYQETPDQLEAIRQTKANMCEPRPMDRLVCGDVGYGKTEVAIRAAFKAMVEKRQVALLAPTTLLVQQHYNTFSERLADYPFKVEMISRFRSTAQINEILRQLKEGEIDLVIGTHRLLSRDVQFRDLGLLIVDEEQRFGVAQKEKIKNLRANVDILTLTATPIPRTLYMALSGLRDLSIITTPPANRHPIKTRTIRFDREQIEEAILRELNRGGQVFFVHNRIETIQDVAQTIREIVPRARIVVAHGQMDEQDLERIMLEFIEGKYDILVSTTIIENGIDIPNVNTIIINRADTFGLAQLYQLRGRVGRDVRQAYAYLILPPGEAITPQAIKRLEALEEFTDLGVGFSIAMRDMEIRGTGNILGREQHGAITDVGFEMYCQLLEEAVSELRGVGAREPLWPVDVKWPVEQFLPEEYIPIESQRIRFYKDIAAAREKDELDLLLEELVDRYGALPEPAINLINACRLKLAAAPWRVDRIQPYTDDTVRIKAPVFAAELAAALAANAAAGRQVFSRLRRSGDQIILALRETDEEWLDERTLAATADYFEALPAPPVVAENSAISA